MFSFVPPTSQNADLYVVPSVFISSVANDVPARRAKVLAATQRPVAAGALSETLMTAPAWKTIPSWYEVGTIDKIIPPCRATRHGRDGTLARG